MKYIDITSKYNHLVTELQERIHEINNGDNIFDSLNKRKNAYKTTTAEKLISWYLKFFIKMLFFTSVLCEFS